MKAYKYLGIAVLSALMMPSCVELVPNEVSEETANVMNLSVKGMLEENLNREYDAVVDPEAGTIIIQVPYYISDVEPRQGNLTKMRVRASLPQGARFEPSIAGTYDMTEGFNSTLTYASGKSQEYHFSAVYVKSDKCEITSVRPYNKRVSVTILTNQPTEPGEKGRINAVPTGDAYEAIKKCVIARSAWSTVEGETVTYDAEDDEYYYDMSSGKDVTIVAQNGVDRTTYSVSFEIPATIDYGINTVTIPWAWQATGAKPHGFEMDANRSLAVADGFLIVSNAYDVDKMLVLDKSSGEPAEGVAVNTVGLPKDRQFRAICSDSKSTLIAMAFTCTDEKTETSEANAWEAYKTDPNIQIYAWVDGIEEPAKLIYEGSITDGDIASCPAKPIVVGNTVSAVGDITKGTANILTHDFRKGRVYVFHFEDGVFNKVWEQCPRNPDGSGSLFWISQWIGSKPVPMTDTPSDTWVDFYIACAQGAKKIYACYENKTIIFETPTSKIWAWLGDAQIINGLDVTTINGAQVMAFGNYWLNNNIWAGRFYVADISMSPNSSSLIDGYLFETRENKEGKIELPGEGYSPERMTSTYPFEGGAPLGTNNIQIKCADIVFDKHADPNSQNMFILSMNAGIICYKLSAYAI